MKQNNFIIKYIYMKKLYLYLYLILALVAIYFYFSRYYITNFVEGYRNAQVYIGENPTQRHKLLLMNDDNSFGWHSVYEVGKIKLLNEDLNKLKFPYGNVYENVYQNAYNYS